MIGVFDSGHGGLTILDALQHRLPRQGFIYLGDHANAPYGQRDPEEIFDLTRQGVASLFGLGCPLVILACNTAAAVALRRLQQDWLPKHFPQQRCLGVLVPMIEAIAQNPWHALAGPGDQARRPETLGVFATPATVTSGAYVHEVAKRAPWLRVHQQPCPDLAGMIEAGAPDAEIAPLIGSHVAAMMARLDGAPLDSVVLGCTHYPLVEHLFRAVLPENTRIVSQPARAADSLTAYLFRHPEMKHFGKLPAEIRAYTSGDASQVTSLASRFFSRHLRFERLPNLADRIPLHA